MNDADDLDLLAGGLTVGEVASGLGVSVRSLHHWDETGLASPSGRTAKGYRLYSASDVARLQRIAIYRELDMPLERIREILDEEGKDPVEPLRAQQERVRAQIALLEARQRGIDRMIEAHEGGLTLTARQQVAISGSEWDPAWPEQARERWGSTPQWAEYAEKASRRSPDEWRRLREVASALERELGAAKREGVEPGAERADELADRHREVFSNYFHLTVSMQVCLARMYEQDERFGAHYDGIEPGLAAWLRRVVDQNARRHGVDPEAAAWE